MTALLFFFFLTPQTDSVIICTGANSHVYHTTTNCHGLSSCHWHIKTVSVSDAKQLGRTACGYCGKLKSTKHDLPARFDSLGLLMPFEGD